MRREAPTARSVPGQQRAGFRGALRSELTKIRTVRSTYWNLAAMIAITVIIGVLACALTGPGAVGPGYDPTYLSLEGFVFGQLIIAVLGVLTFTSEYSTGMIHMSLTVQPRRKTVFAAKAVAVAILALAAGLAASFASFLLGQTILARRDLGTSLSQPHVLRAVIGAGLFLAVSGLLALGLGAVFRSHRSRQHHGDRGAVRVAPPGNVPAQHRADGRGQVDPAQRGQPDLVHRQRSQRSPVLALGWLRRVHRLCGRVSRDRAGPLPLARCLNLLSRTGRTSVMAPARFRLGIGLAAWRCDLSKLL